MRIILKTNEEKFMSIDIMDIKRQFVWENKNSIICEPSGLSYRKKLLITENPILSEIVREDELIEYEHSIKKMYKEIDNL
jgi:hypothetical protein